MDIDKTIKTIQVRLFDEKRDTITGDCIYWVSKNTLFPFDTKPKDNQDHELLEKLELVLSLSNNHNKANMLAKLLRTELQHEIDNAEELESEPPQRYKADDERCPECGHRTCECPFSPEVAKMEMMADLVPEPPEEALCKHGWTNPNVDCPQCEFDGGA